MTDDVEEILANHWLAAAKVHVEHLECGEFVDYGERFGGGELFGVAATRRAETVNARQVAGIGEFPGETDRSIETTLELLHERWGLRNRGGLGDGDVGHVVGSFA